MTHLILTHQQSDFDAVASMLGAHKLYPDGTPILSTRLNRNVAEFLTLYQGGLPFVNRDDLPRQKIDKITLTDTQSFESPKGIKPKTPIHMIEHHTTQRDFAAHETYDYYELGAITTWFVEQIQEQHIAITTLEATLLALGIYEDTGMLTYGSTTPRDVRAAAFLLERGAVLDTIRRFLQPPLNAEQQKLFETLMDNVDHFTVHGYTIAVAVAHAEKTIHGVNSVASRLRDALDVTGLFVFVAMEDIVQMVARSTDDAINVGAAAEMFGSGGHTRASAAVIKGMTPEEAREHVRRYLYETVRPAVCVADLMSYQPRTVQASDVIQDILPLLRRIGHEGYPVLEDKEVIGLLTLRDADRAMEHGLTQTTVREVMQGGPFALSPDDSIFELEQTMVKSGRGQLPVVDAHNAVIGIITRTDLLKYWARTHPTTAPRPRTVTIEQVTAGIGAPALQLVEHIAQHAQKQGIALYMVGGVVRDILIGRPNFDIDFVMEGDAIAFTEALAAQVGGRVSSHRPFGTAKWYLDDAVKQALGITGSLPEHLDFVTARNEFYTHPTALPTVYSASIRLDAARRDFTINALAIQVSPMANQWRVQDLFGGLDDLERRLIRVLHSLSFVDDPTRILRGVRFSQRLNFTIETRTAELIHSALPMLNRITGERLRHELTLLMQESEPERGLMHLQTLGALEAIHPALHFSPELAESFKNLRITYADLPTEERTTLLWYAWLTSLDDIAGIMDRLLFAGQRVQAVIAAARIRREAAELAAPDTLISRVVMTLERLPAEALTMVLRLIPADQRAVLEERYAHRLTRVPRTDGNILQKRGVSPGPIYKRVLDKLRIAWLDGEVTTPEQEETLLKQLLREKP
jgi:tRNA nucleotidyltransferase (CCA-adding enzyme)